MKKAGVAGSVCLDINPVFRAGQPVWLEEGKQTDLDDMRITLGGCVGNTGLALYRLGLPVKVFCKVGNDSLGSFVNEMLRNSGIEAVVERSDEKSSASVIISPPGKDRMILHKSGASQTITENDIPDDFFSGMSLFHFGYPPKMKRLWADNGTGMAKLLERVHANGVATSVDMCMPNAGDSADSLTSFLRHTDIFLPSYEEMLRLLRPDEYERVNRIAAGNNLIEYIDERTIAEIAEWALGMGVHIILLKLGKKGLYLRTGDKASSVPGLELGSEWNGRELWMAPKLIRKPVSTIGAGDTAIAGFLASVLSSYDPELAMSVASCTAAECIESSDRGHNMPSLDVIRETAVSDYKQEMLSVGITGWERRGKVLLGPADK
mgnify:CR=1 FL=1